MAKQVVGELVYKITGDSNQLTSEITKADGQVKNFGQSMSNMSLKSIASTAALGAGVAALGGVLVSAAKKAISFETTMANIQTVAGGGSAAMEELHDGILDLTKVIPKSADELGAAAYDILSSGVTDATDALSVLKASGKLAVAGLGSTKEAADLLTSAINAFGLEASEADKVANTIFTSVNLGKTTVAELAQSFGNVAVAAKGTGVTFEEVQAATAALTLVGNKTSTSQDRLRALFDEMTRSSGKLAEGIKAVGIENVGTAIKSDGFKSVLDQLYKATGSNDIAFKNLFSSVEAGGAALALVTTASDKYTESLNAMQTSSGDLEKAFGVQADTTANQLVVAQNQLNLLMIQLGERVLPILNKVLEKVIGFMDLLTSASDRATAAANKNIDAQDQLVNQAQIYKDRMNNATKAGDEQTAALAKNARQIALTKAQISQLNYELTQQHSFIKKFNTETGRYEEFFDKNSRQVAILAEIKAKEAEVTALQTEETNAYMEAVKNESLAVIDANKVTTNQTDLIVAAQKAEQAREEATRKAAEATKKAADDLKAFQTEMVGMIDKSVEAREALENGLAESFKKFGEEVKGTLDETNQSLAKTFIEAGDEITQLRARLSKEEDAERQAEIRKEIEKNQAILDSRVGFEERQQAKIDEIRKRLADAGIKTDGISGLESQRSLEDQIKEQRRIDALDEFARFEEEQFKKLDILTNNIIAENELVQGKIEKQKELEADLTAFLLSTNEVRQKSVDDFANASIKKYQEMASELSRAVSLQSRLNQLRANPNQFHEGGMVGAGGGEVHAGEYVIPANMVRKMGSAISALESSRRNGGNVNNSRVVNAPVTMNNVIDGNVDFNAVGKSLAWELGRL